MTGKVESKTKNTGKRWVRRLGALWLALTAACTGAGMPALAETSIPNQTQQQSAAVPVSGETATAETSVKTAAVENETGAGETGTQAAGNILTDTVSPVGTTINLFDYWITTRFAPGQRQPGGYGPGHQRGQAAAVHRRRPPATPTAASTITPAATSPAPALCRTPCKTGIPCCPRGTGPWPTSSTPTWPMRARRPFPGCATCCRSTTSVSSQY